MVYPSPVWCVGTYDAKGEPNIMTASWGGICCSQPPAVTVSLRKATYTYGCLMAAEAYTISVPPKSYAAQVDFFGMASGKRTKKFAEAGLTPVKAEKVNAPYVAEFPMIIECKVIHTYEIGLHTQFIGEIMDIKVDESMIGKDGYPDMLIIDPFLYAAEQGKYYGVGAYIGDAYDIGKKFLKPNRIE